MAYNFEARMQAVPETNWQFGDFELDSKAFVLRRLGRAVKIERIPMDLLILLLERHGDLVSREEIVDRLWGKETFVDSENSVNTAVRKVRMALRDDTSKPAFVQTVTGKGYRFCAEVTARPSTAADPLRATADLPQPALAAAEDNTAAAKPGRPRPKLKIAAAVAACVLLVLAFLVARASFPGSKVSADQVTLALLPFENLTGSPDQDYFADGLTEETIGVLGRVNPQRLKVIARSSTSRYKRQTKGGNKAGEELGADYLVDGSVRRDQERVRVTVHLIRVRDGAQIWSENYDRIGSGVIQLQDDLGNAIARQIQVELSPAGGTTMQQTRVLDAYDPYLLGRHSFVQITPNAVRKSIDYYQAAIAKDPSYALAFAGLAESYTLLPITSDVAPREVWPLASKAAAEAVRLNSSLAEAQASAGWVNFWLDWDWDGAAERLRRAIQLNPSSAVAHGYYAHVLSNARQHEGALAEIAMARRLDPLSPIRHAMTGQFLYNAGRYAEATAALEKAFAIDPRFWVAHLMMAQIQEREGKLNEALSSIDKAFQFSGGNSATTSLKGYVLARNGQRAEAERILNTLLTAGKSRFVPPYNIAIIYAGFGDRKAALEWLDKAYEARDVHMIFLTVDAKWNDLREDPKFQELLQRCHFGRKQ